MAPKSDNVALKHGDIVSAAAYSWGRAFAREMGDNSGRKDDVRVEGKVLRPDGIKWVVDFGDEEHISWKRTELRFVSRPGATEPVRASRASRPIVREDSSDDEQEPQDDDAGDHGGSDATISDDEEEGCGRVGQPDHALRDPAGVANGEWTRDDTYSLDERARHGFTTFQGPTMKNMDDWRTAPLLEYAKHFLPLTYLETMAAEMQHIGQQKYNEGQRRFDKWVVTLEDLLQWIGVWTYMLAFPQQSSTRRSFFQAPLGGYGPAHNLQNILLLGGRGKRGLSWFENMMNCFTLPQWRSSLEAPLENGERVPRSAKYSKDDPFAPTRRFWDSLRAAFMSAMECGWLLCLDESMVKWTGRGMPGLMVILRKPTPVGLELHTLCDSSSGVLAWFEVYEGKDAMAKKPFNDKHPKSIALTLRMLEPYFGTVCAVAVL